MKPLVAGLAACCFASILTGSAPAQPESSPVITRSEPQDWRMLASVTLGSRIDTPAEAMLYVPPDQHTTQPVQLAEDPILRPDGAVGAFSVEEATVYFPVAGSAAGYEVDRLSLKAEFLYKGQPIPIRPSLYERDASGQPVHSGGAYGVWSFGPAAEFVGNVVLQFEFEARSWNTRLDEDAARAVAWPKGDWPAEAASSFAPMLFIDYGYDDTYDTASLKRLVKEWTGDQPKSQPPFVLAKWLAGQVAQRFQPDGQLAAPDTIAANSVQAGRSLGAMQAVNVFGAQFAAEEMTGSPVDMVLLLTALYREAGLPARPVVGYVAGEAGGAAGFGGRSDQPEIGPYAWVEFALYDETKPSLGNSLTWVPVDILAMRAGNVGRRPFDQHWDGFGSGEYFNQLVPIAYHLHPHNLPAVSYGQGQISGARARAMGGVRLIPLPSLWGWNLVPFTPICQHQTMSLSATTPSRSAEDVRRERRGGGR